MSNYIRINLQLFADGPGGEKTEKATSTKREDARTKGTVMKSVEVITALILLTSFFTIRAFSGSIYKQTSGFVIRVISKYSIADNALSLNSLYEVFLDGLITFILCAGPVLVVALLTAFIANVAQVGFKFSTEAISFKPNKINPINGLKRMFSMKNTVNLLKSLLKVIIIGMLAYTYIRSRLDGLMMMMRVSDIFAIVKMGIDLVFGLVFQICVAMLILAFFDYGYQWWQFEKDLKMTKQEVKEEYKQMEGDPKVKSKIKEKQRQISMQRMMSDVPKADVVITNPTHFAVAIKYDLDVADAPVVLAKGQDYLAHRIRQIARENGVEIVENKPLARSLFESAEIGEKIPVDLYQAVAEVLAFVYNLKNKKIV
jgi:flagellar biosynthetic protein FlhB